MGLLDSVLNAITGAPGAANSQLPGSGQAPGASQAALLLGLVTSLLKRNADAAEPTGGGLGGLIGRFQQGGLGDVVNSWIGTGHNLPISPEQLQNVLGSDVVAQLAQRFGLSHHAAADQLAEALPQAVDQLTPQGQLPAEAEAGDGGLGDIGNILGQFARR